MFSILVLLFISKNKFTHGGKHYAFPVSPVENVKVQIVTNTNRTLESFFVHKKPPREILTKMEAN